MGMKSKDFECNNCGAEGIIKFVDDGEHLTSDVAYCPFCGHDIHKNDEDDMDWSKED
jgi:predicted RNA-binding Zn-ribbon protein involved in translation (DUF1610 family)